MLKSGLAHTSSNSPVTVLQKSFGTAKMSTLPFHLWLLVEVTVFYSCTLSKSRTTSLYPLSKSTVTVLYGRLIHTTLYCIGTWWHYKWRGVALQLAASTLYFSRHIIEVYQLRSYLLSTEVKSQVERRSNLLCSLFSHDFAPSWDDGLFNSDQIISCLLTRPLDLIPYT